MMASAPSTAALWAGPSCTAGELEMTARSLDWGFRSSGHILTAVLGGRL